MKNYIVNPRSESKFEPFTVQADSYSDAATKASHELNGPRTHGLRQTGEPSMSGVFQGYCDFAGGESSVGGNFHLGEE